MSTVSEGLRGNSKYGSRGAYGWGMGHVLEGRSPQGFWGLRLVSPGGRNRGFYMLQKFCEDVLPSPMLLHVQADQI